LVEKLAEITEFKAVDNVHFRSKERMMTKAVLGKNAVEAGKSDTSKLDAISLRSIGEDRTYRCYCYTGIVVAPVFSDDTSGVETSCGEDTTERSWKNGAEQDRGHTGVRRVWVRLLSYGQL
jgi:hypothetical protein